MSPHLIFPKHQQFKTHTLNRMTNTSEDTIEVKVIGITFYPNEIPRLIVEYQKGAIFFDIPLHDLLTTLAPSADLIYKISPNESPVFSFLPCFDTNLAVYDRTGDLNTYGEKVKYLHTVEWVRNNEMFHILRIDNHIKVWPHHKLWVGSVFPDSLPILRKIEIKEK